jgi:hypothetical protein
MKPLNFAITLILLSVLISFSCSDKPTLKEKWKKLQTTNFTDLLANAYDLIETSYFDSIVEILNDSVSNYLATTFYLKEDLKKAQKPEFRIKEPEDHQLISRT